MSCKTRALAAAFMTIALCAVSAFAQGRILTVSQVAQSDNADAGMFKTIQAAVNAAQQGDIVEIEDLAVYKEQVTVDSTKHGITIRSKNPTSVTKPTIQWQDVTNRSPKNYAESLTPGEGPGTSGNFETCGALRIIRARGVTIDGIAVDGGGAAPFAWDAVWGNTTELFHGNAAITLVVANGTVVRNCDIRNAYFGVNIKDRNTGGVFGNPNPEDNDYTIPLSRFGKVGHHLIEHNRIRDNSVAFFFESAWDLGSTVRYNLIYSNYHRKATVDAINAASNTPDNQVSGAFLFKDMVYTPIAIHNNTLYDNAGNFFANWKVGTTHLIFNNIYSKPHYPIGTPSAQLPKYLSMRIDHAFPFRMNNCLFSATDQIQSGSVHTPACNIQAINLHNQNIFGMTRVSVNYQFSPMIGDDITSQVTCPAASASWWDNTTNSQRDSLVPERVVTTTGFVIPGSVITPTDHPTATGNLRWLETVATTGVEGTQDLFVSTDPDDPDFLRPKWDHPLVVEFIKNKGWAAVGIRNSDGEIADIGAIPFTGKRPAVSARIMPTSVVMIDTNTRRVDLMFNLYTDGGGTFESPKIKFLRWVSPLPSAGTPPEFNWGGGAGDMTYIRENSIVDITPPATAPVVGSNVYSFTLPSGTRVGEYGFFEIVIEGTNAGTLVSSDVGFLPYRRLNYVLDIKVVDEAGKVINDPVVTAGDHVRLRVVAMERNASGALVEFVRGGNSRPLETTYTLFSHATARMWQTISPNPGDPLESDNDLKTDGNYFERYSPIYFTRAGDETISGAGIWCDRDCDDESALRLSFLGALNLTVLPGPPAKVTFIDPIPKSQIPAGGLATVINRGMDRDVVVQVQDRFGNASTEPVPVHIRSEKPGIGDVLSAGNRNCPTIMDTTAGPCADSVTVMTDNTGAATFQARVTNGTLSQTFDMTAWVTFSSVRSQDVGTLRVGRTTEALRVFYTEPTSKNWKDDYDDPDYIEGAVGDWLPVWVQIASSDTVMKKEGVFICVTATGIHVSLSETGASSSEQVVGPLVDGKMLVYVGAAPNDNRDDIEGRLDVKAMIANNCNGTADASIGTGQRGDIFFTKPDVGVASAKVMSIGNGFGRPDRVEIDFAGEATFDIWELPDSVTLRWPAVDGPSATVGKASIERIDDRRVAVDFSSAANLPNGHTGAPDNGGRGLVTVYGGPLGPGNSASSFNVTEAIGIVLSSTEDGAKVLVDTTEFSKISPLIRENSDNAVQDTLMFYLSETYGTSSVWVGASLLVIPSAQWSADGRMAEGGTPVEVLGIIDNAMGGFKAALPVGQISEGDWVRLNSEAAIIDPSGNAVLDGNRWVQVGLQETPPVIEAARYEDDDADGLADKIYITFSKSVSAAEIKQFKFSWGDLSDEQDGVPDCGCVTAGTDANTVVITLRGTNAFPKAREAIRTSGDISVEISFDPSKAWPPLIALARDSAAPVLVSAVWKTGALKDDGSNDSHPDTLTVVYSETLNSESITAALPVSIRSGSTWISPTLTQTGSVPQGNYLEVKYVVTNPNGYVASENDSVIINVSSSITDDVGTSQDNELNNRVLLRLINDPQWVVTVRNNPFPSGGKAKVEYSPRLGPNVEVKVTLRLFNNMGNLVIDSVFTQKGSTVWEWDGRNKHGRFVGTGTYLLKVRCEAKGPGVENPFYEPKAQRIGFVRGKTM